mmetsp:Transcript_23986/g.27624  ORF Transcript_23986/g.27624 Transcript_23986/m.27624 type:complete len:119 (+) Transcript_23986:126-482(+)
MVHSAVSEHRATPAATKTNTGTVRRLLRVVMSRAGRMVRTAWQVHRVTHVVIMTIGGLEQLDSIVEPKPVGKQGLSVARGLRAKSVVLGMDRLIVPGISWVFALAAKISCTRAVKAYD